MFSIIHPLMHHGLDMWFKQGIKANLVQAYYYMLRMYAYMHVCMYARIILQKTETKEVPM